MVILENEEQAVLLLNKDDDAKNNKFEYPTVRERKMKEKKLRPLGLNTNHVLNFESSFDQPNNGGNFFSSNGNSAAFVTHSSDHRRPDQSQQIIDPALVKTEGASVGGMRSPPGGRSPIRFGIAGHTSPRRLHHFAEISTINASTERTNERSLMADII